MNLQDIAAISSLLGQNEEDEQEFSSINNNPNKGSVFAPSDISSNGQKKDVAKPFAQIEVKVGQQQNQQEQQDQKDQQQPKQQQQRKKDKNDIWDIEEVQVQSKPIQDNRQRPEVEVMYKQSVAAEDVYGGWSGIDPSSLKCQALLLKIQLPNTKGSELQLEVYKQELVLQTTKYYLDYILPYQVQEKNGKAKWISDKFVLEIELPILREELF
ncbi:hypothetical protein pb186bvf_010015 [Paramecium bursaria]